MDSQNNHDQGLSLPQPQPVGAATMPLPPLPMAGAVQVLPATPDADAGTLTPATPPSGAGFQAVQTSQSVYDAQQAPPVPATEPPLSPLPTVLRPAVTLPAEVFTETPSQAADTDVIEKEWVMKAKQVMVANRSDPFRQVQEINKVKADYMKKRYNKDIKLLDA